MGKKTIILAAFLTVLIMNLSSALANSVDIPPNAEFYYYTGANMSTNRNFPSTGTPIGNLVLTFSHAENKDETEGNTVFVSINSPKGTIPFGFVTNNPEAIETMHAAFANTQVYINRGGQVKDNVKLVTGEKLIVERRGNRIVVDFNPASTITLVYNLFPDWPSPHPGYPLTLPLVVPAFHVEFNKQEGSEHTFETKVLTAGPPLYLSGYTVTNERMGFHADADFTCQAWINPATSAGWITMHGIETWIPP